MNTLLILILDPRGVISAGKNDVIERHRNYGKELAKQNKELDYRLKIFTASTKEISTSKNNKTLDIVKISKPTFNSYKFAKRAHKYIESKVLRNEDCCSFCKFFCWKEYFLAL